MSSTDRVVVFDLGGVVCRWLPDRRLLALAELSGLPPATIDQLVFDPDVLGEIERYAAVNNLPRQVVQDTARRYAREIVPSFSAYAYFGFATRAARWLSTMLYRVRLGYTDEDALKTVPGVTSKMLVKFGENGIKTVEDLAGCATDDLVGWTERKEGGESTKLAGALDGIEISRDEAEHLIMQARVKAGWITEADLASQNAAPEAAEAQP